MYYTYVNVCACLRARVCVCVCLRKTLFYCQIYFANCVDKLHQIIPHDLFIQQKL